MSTQIVRRISILAIVTLFVFAFVIAFTGCGKAPTTDTLETTAVTEAGTENIDTETESPYVRELEELSDEEYLSRYLEAFASHVDDEGSFSDDNETKELMEKLEVKREDVHYPIKINGVLLYVGDGGWLQLRKFEGGWGNSRTITYNVHIPTTTDGKAIKTESNFSAIYTQETGVLEFYSFGDKNGEYDLPEGAEYVGYSTFYGYEFRAGSDVYVCAGYHTDEPVCIAHGVKFVILPDYRFGSDPWCQPLLLMEDGSIKCHISWRGDENAPLDDPSHLIDVVAEGVEGGYGH